MLTRLTMFVNLIFLPIRPDFLPLLSLWAYI